MNNSKVLSGLNVLLINPKLFPCDLRNETHASDQWKSERAINFGLLQIGSVLYKRGAHVKIVDLEEEEIDVLKVIEEFAPGYVGIGNISCYSFLNTIELTEQIKSEYPDITVVVGGQNVSMATYMFWEKGCKADYLTVGYAEETTTKIGISVLEGRQLSTQAGIINCKEATKSDYYHPVTSEPLDNIDDYAFLEYELYPHWKKHIPLVEESRGCPFSCNFCGNSKTCNSKKIFYAKSPHVIKQEIERAYRMWNFDGKMPMILMCANFGTVKSRTKELLKLIEPMAGKLSLMAAMRVDSHWEEYVELMAKTFDQIHFGLESGSPEILLRMNKTKNPEYYLSKASSAFAAFHNAGVHVGCNFIFGYPGENGKTVGETIAFLLNNRKNIDSLWGGSIIEYPGCPLSDKIQKYTDEFGAKRVRLSKYSDILHAYPIAPSKAFTFEQMSQLSALVMKIFNNKTTFYEHYKWYPGLVNGCSLLGIDEFYQLFLANTDPAELGLDITRGCYD